MNVNVYNLEGKKVGTIDLPDRIFGLSLNSDLLYQALMVQLSKNRQPIAHTKSRADVRGGGRKPWRQKGTGRARHGSIRSPIWIGGGITFGPTKERNFKRKINKKMKKKALFVALSSKVHDNEMVIVDDLSLREAKTKAMNRVLHKLLDKKKKLKKLPSTLVITENMNVMKANKNIPFTKSLKTDSLNVADLLRHKYVIMPKQSIDIIEKHFSLNK